MKLRADWLKFQGCKDGNKHEECPGFLTTVESSPIEKTIVHLCSCECHRIPCGT